jgi:enamine deaminase RidA (YjgF/YER057c/UK114 family)
MSCRHRLQGAKRGRPILYTSATFQQRDIHVSSAIQKRLTEIGVVLPPPGTPGGNYVPFVIVGNLVFMAGQVAREAGRMKYTGKVGRDLSVEDGQAAARLCAVNLLAQLKAACGGDLDRVDRCVRVGGFVNSPPDFVDHPKVVNGASDLMVEVFGERGQHARTAVGVAALPLDSAVEVEAVFLLKRQSGDASSAEDSLASPP